MKKQLKEEVLRIKDMMKKINEDEFDNGISSESPKNIDKINELVKMGLDTMPWGDVTINQTKYGRLSSRYKSKRCDDISGSVSNKVNLDELMWYVLTIEFDFECEEDPDGVSTNLSIHVEISDSSDEMSSKFESENIPVIDDLYDKLSPELQDEIRDNVQEYLDESYNDDDEDDYSSRGLSRSDFM